MCRHQFQPDSSGHPGVSLTDQIHCVLSFKFRQRPAVVGSPLGNVAEEMRYKAHKFQLNFHLTTLNIW